MGLIYSELTYRHMICSVLMYMISFRWETLIILFTPRPLDNYVIPLYTVHFVCTNSVAFLKNMIHL